MGNIAGVESEMVRPQRAVVFDFKSSSSKKSEYRVKERVAIAVVDRVILDVIIISGFTIILSRLDWILK